MIQNRTLLAAAALCLLGVPVAAQDSCRPVETAPGIKSVPSGCNKFTGQPPAGNRAASALPGGKAAPAGKPSALFPGAAPGTITMFGDTEVRIGGQVRVEYGAGR
jgi:hypothetical protein